MKISIKEIIEKSRVWNEIDPLDFNSQVDEVDPIDSWNRLIIKHKKSKNQKWLAYAASISLITLALIGIYQLFDNPLIEITASKDVVEHLLPDSSVVWIRLGSVLSYRQSFGETSRNIMLDGTGFFQVTSNKDLPFVIQSSRSKIEVLGTSFLYETEGSPHVQVFTGTVRFHNNAAIYETLQKGQAAVLMPSGTFENQSFDYNTISWKTRKLVFTDQPITHVLDVVSQFYHVKLSMNNSEDIQITATFNNITLEEALDFLEIVSEEEIQITK